MRFLIDECLHESLVALAHDVTCVEYDLPFTRT